MKNDDIDFKGDQIDRANARAELLLRVSIANAKPAGPEATGYCLNCDARLAPKQRWCDAHCRDDWEKTQRAAAMAPREPDPV